MTWLIAALVAAFINGTSAIFDKKLLGKQGLADPVAYTFWVGLLGLFVIVLAPFGFIALPLKTILIALLGGVIFIFALFTFFTALYKYSALGFLQLVGGFTPVLTLFVSSIFLQSVIGLGNMLGLVILILGTFVFLRMEEHGARYGVFSLAILSAVLFSISDILKKIAFSQGPFLTVFIWSSVGGALVALGIIAFPALRRRVFQSAKGTAPRNKGLYLLNRGWAASAAIATHYALFLGHPALVEAVLSFKYVIVFLAAVFVLKEKMAGKILFWKFFGMILIIAGIAWLGLVNYIHSLPVSTHMEWGVTFSDKFSRELEGDGWKKAYTDILDDFGVKKLRLIAYWDLVEPKKNEFDFADLDWQIDEAQKREAEVILALGRKTPRWPECHEPDWAKKLWDFDAVNYEKELLGYIQTTVLHYKNNPAIKVWQVENEPLFPFGLCKPTGLRFLTREIALVKSLDSRPIALTDSGELGFAWPLLAIKGDMFGTTLYRYVYNRIFGNIRYSLIPPGYFQLKKIWAHDILGKDIFIAELQGEPWPPQGMNPTMFAEIADYAKASGFSTAYWWGVEWWHEQMIKENKPEMWNLAKQLFNQ
ncbi:MAG: EamA family transporter [bacterium]|nr:EamA family transporter [bacterium]